MASDPSVRPAERDDLDRLSTIAERSMRTSYGLRPQAIEAVADAEFGVDTLAEKIENPAVTLVLAERDDEPVGFVEGVEAPAEGTVRWIHVDPDARGRGVGETLFERVDTELGPDDADSARKLVFADNAEGRTFIEHLGFERAGEREVEIGGQQFLEYVYVEGDDDSSSGGDRPESTTPAANQPPATAADLPATADTADGTVFLASDPLAGTEGVFARLYDDQARTEPYGYYCDNCGSTDVSVDTMERLRCPACSNARTADADDDSSYL